MAINFKLIGRQVKEFRTSKHMSQADLAEQIDRSVTYVSLIETAAKQASLTTLVLIANALCITVDSLLTGNQSNDSEEYHTEFTHLLEDCNKDEKRFIFEMAFAAKRSLRVNCWLQENIEEK